MKRTLKNKIKVIYLVVAIVVLLSLLYFVMYKTTERENNLYSPGVQLKGVKREVVFESNFGNNDTEIGNDPKYYEAVERHRCTFCLGLTSDSKVDFLCLNANNGILVDFYNSRIANIDLNNFSIQPYRLINFSLLKKTCEDVVRIKVTPSLERIFITSADKVFYEVNNSKSSLIEKPINKLYEGSRIIVFEGSDYFKEIDLLVKNFKNKHPDYLDFSFDIDKNGNCYVGFLTKSNIQVFKLTKGEDKFNRFIEKSYTPIKTEIKIDWLKIFAEDKNIYIALFYGKSHRRIITGEIIEGYGGLLSIDNETLQTTLESELIIKGWSKFTISNNAIYTWDSTFLVDKFHIYKYPLRQ